MAQRAEAKLVFCIFLFITCCTVSQTQLAVDCCLSVIDKPIDKKIVADYRQQVAGQGCAIDAAIFVTRHGRKLCLSPNGTWIPKVIEHVQFLKNLCKKRNYKMKRCFGVKPE